MLHPRPSKNPIFWEKQDKYHIFVDFLQSECKQGQRWVVIWISPVSRWSQVQMDKNHDQIAYCYKYMTFN